MVSNAINGAVLYDHSSIGVALSNWTVTETSGWHIVPANASPFHRRAYDMRSADAGDQVHMSIRAVYLVVLTIRNQPINKYVKTIVSETRWDSKMLFWDEKCFKTCISGLKFMSKTRVFLGIKLMLLLEQNTNVTKFRQQASMCSTGAPRGGGTRPLLHNIVLYSAQEHIYRGGGLVPSCSSV